MKRLKLINRLAVSKKAAFTLAETLITLGIIGVVAALTTPFLISKYEKWVTVVRLQKVYAELNSNLRVAISENGDIDDWDWSQNNAGGFSTLLDKYFGITNKNTNIYWKQTNDTGRFAFCAWGTAKYTKNGQIMCISNFMSGGYTWSMGPNVYIIVDINGAKKPNRIGRDAFVFLIPSSNLNDGCSQFKRGYYNHKSNFVYPNGYKCPRDILLQGCNNQGGDYNGSYCAELIRSDGWKIKDDYPW